MQDDWRIDQVFGVTTSLWGSAQVPEGATLLSPGEAAWLVGGWFDDGLRGRRLLIEVCEAIDPVLVSGVELDTRRLMEELRGAFRRGRIVAYRLPYPRAAPAASSSQIDQAPPPPAGPPPVQVIPTLFVVQWVDEIGSPIGGLDVVFSVSGRREKRTTGGDGVARFVDTNGSNFAFADPASIDAVREAVRPRWDNVREGEVVTEAEAIVFQLREDLIEGIQLQSEEMRIISVQPHVTRTRLLGGGFFDTSRSFILPNGLGGVRAIVANYKQAPNAKLLIVGHTDLAGTPDYNDPLSLERAEALKDYLTDNVDGWLPWYGQVPLEKRWGAKEDRLMIESLPDAPTRSPQEPPVLWFQRTRGLTVDGIAGPETRRQLVTEYMALDGTSLPSGIEPIVHGCGENFPQDPTPDGVADSDNRRVEVFFFDGSLGVQPPPPRPELRPRVA